MNQSKVHLTKLFNPKLVLMTVIVLSLLLSGAKHFVFLCYQSLYNYFLLLHTKPGTQATEKEVVRQYGFFLSWLNAIMLTLFLTLVVGSFFYFKRKSELWNYSISIILFCLIWYFNVLAFTGFELCSFFSIRHFQLNVAELYFILNGSFLLFLAFLGYKLISEKILI